MMKSLISSALALAALSVAGSAQQTSTPLSVQGTPGHATIDMATGVLTRDAQDKAATLVITWANTDYSGYYGAPPAVTEEWLDWGVLSVTSGSEIVGSYQFGYGTTSLDTTVGGPGASLCTSFYSGAVGWCAESGLGMQPDYQICWSGLPGTATSGVAAGWIITVTLTGGFEFELPAGPFGYSVTLTTAEVGPLLCYAGNTATTYDANGQEDAFNVYNPDVATGGCGTYWFGGGAHNFSSWWMYIAQADGSGTVASSTFYCGSGVNLGGYTVTADAQLGGTFSSNVTHARFGALLYAFASPLSFNFGGQQILINFLDPAGMLFGSPPVGIGSGTSIDLPVPINLAFCGMHIFVQAVSFGGGFDLHCAYDVLIGF